MTMQVFADPLRSLTAMDAVAYGGTAAVHRRGGLAVPPAAWT